MSNDDTTYDHKIYLLGGKCSKFLELPPKNLVFNLGTESKYCSLHWLDVTKVQSHVGLNMIQEVMEMLTGEDKVQW